jgi:Zn-dependent metalloprotease
MVVISILLLQSTPAMSSTTALGSPSSSGDLQITRDPATGAVTFLRSRKGLDSGVTLETLNRDPAAAVRTFLMRVKDLLGMPRILEELAFKKKSVDNIGMIHIRLRQVYRGVPVHGAELVVHYAPDGKTVRAFNGRFIPRLGVDQTPILTSDDAIAAVREVQPQGDLWEEPLLRIYSGHIDASVSGNHLAWLVRIYDEKEPSRNLYVVNAHTGEILTSYNELDTVLDREVYDAQNGFILPGVLVREEGDDPIGDTDADNAYDFLGDTYNYFWVNFGRNSYDDAGAGLVASVHYRVNYKNAFWNGIQMVFGDGFTVDDVTAHELAHAVTDFTADLIYRDQSGALNESFSDIFGEFVDQLNLPPDPSGDDWLIGEDLPGIGAIRDMSNPPAFGDPDKASDFLCTTDDNGGVHTNSGIPNKAAYLMAAGDTFNGYTVQSIGLYKTGQVQYRTLAFYLTPSSGFVDYYDAMNTSCQDLYGSSPFGECTQVKNALLATEMDTAPDCGSGWGAAYGQLLESRSDLALLRRYRGEILMNSKAGILYTRLLYESSQEALEVLNQNPELMSRAADLIVVNKEAVAAVLDGGEGVIHNTDEIISFLQDYARKSPGLLRFLANKVSRDMKKSKNRGKLFLKFRLY